MESSHGLHVKKIYETKLGEILKTAETFFKAQPEITNSIKDLNQKSYSTAVSDKIFKGRSLPKLLIDGFDEEQIWQQIELLNKTNSSNISKLLRNFNANNVLLTTSKTLRLKSSSGNESDKQRTNDKVHGGNEDEFCSEESSAEEELQNKGASSDISEFAGNFNSKNRVLTTSESPTIKPSSGNENDKLRTNNKVSDKNEDKFCSQESSSEEEEYAFDDDSDSPTDFDKDTEKKPLPQKKSRYTSVVDDQFFKLSKLEDFLRVEDIKEERGEENVSENEIDLFQDIPSDGNDDSDEESDDESGKNKKSSRDLMYGDFFDDPESEIGDENDTTMDDHDESIMDKNADYSEDESRSDIEMEDITNKGNSYNVVSENVVDHKNNQKTAFELEQEKIRKKIQEYEKSMLQPLPWHLTGEVAAGSRPIDSLIDQETDFNSNTKQDLLVDKALTEKIEEITIMAIMNKAFFDVERKYKPTEDVISYKKEVAVEQTKSKKSLAEVYEEDFLKKQSKPEGEEKENPKHKEIKKLMDSLLPQLHVLFSHIPKPAIPEIKIVSNLPAITVEEVAPTSVSDATLLAPEEVKKKSGLIKGSTERTDTDRKRERRKKKIHQRLKEKKRLEKSESQQGNPSAKVSKLEKLQTLKKLKQHKNTKIANIDEGGKIKSSKDFFSRLQDTVDTKDKAKNKTGVLYKKKKMK